jgi:acyl-CoA dehydrogenase
MNTGLDEDVAALYDTARRFAEKEIAPHINDWDEAGTFPRTLYKPVPPKWGCWAWATPRRWVAPAPFALRNAVSLALARHCGSGGVMASLFSHNIGLPPVLRHGGGTAAQGDPARAARREIAALAITEPGGGSDVASLRTTARREGGDWVINGEKVFITSGMRADWITVAVRTGDAGARGAGGISMIVVPGDAPGLHRTELNKMGWWCSDTAHLRFDNVRVPAGHLLGEEGRGFKIIMTNFNGERLAMSVMALGFAQACLTRRWTGRASARPLAPR